MGAEGDSSDATAIAGGAGSGSDEVAVNIRCSNGSKFSVRTTLDSPVGAFKALVAQNCDVPADQQRLIYKGRILKDDQTLVSYENQSQIYSLLRSPDRHLETGLEVFGWSLPLGFLLLNSNLLS